MSDINLNKRALRRGGSVRRGRRRFQYGGHTHDGNTGHGIWPETPDGTNPGAEHSHTFSGTGGHHGSQAHGHGNTSWDAFPNDPTTNEHYHSFLTEGTDAGAGHTPPGAHSHKTNTWHIKGGLDHYHNFQGDSLHSHSVPPKPSKKRRPPVLYERGGRVNRKNASAPHGCHGEQPAGNCVCKCPPVVPGNPGGGRAPGNCYWHCGKLARGGGRVSNRKMRRGGKVNNRKMAYGGSIPDDPFRRGRRRRKRRRRKTPPKSK